MTIGCLCMKKERKTKRECRTIGFDAARGAGACREVAPTITTTPNATVAVLNARPTKIIKAIARKRGGMPE